MEQQDINRVARVAVEDAMAGVLEPFKEDLGSIRRALEGAPQEGNPGILRRVERAEQRLAILIWMLPIWVTVGTGLGQLLIQLWL